MNDLLRKLPIGIQTFEKLRKGDYLYVDKTELVWKIAYTSTPYFLSRPRRFGKSLLLSTFEAYFEGKKELFEGLAIEKLETKWEKHPVLHLDLNALYWSTLIGYDKSICRTPIIILFPNLILITYRPLLPFVQIYI